MALIKCPECGKEISIEPTVTENKTKKALIVAVVVSAIVILFTLGFCIFNQPFSKASEIDFAQLRADYDANSITAAEKYDGKRFYFYIDVKAISSDCSLSCAIYDSYFTDSTKAYTSGAGFGEAWQSTTHIAWGFDAYTSEKEAVKMKPGSIYYVEGLLNVKYNGNMSGFYTGADITEIKVIKEII